MKTKLILGMFAIALVSTTSCKKPRTCTCTDQYGGSENSTIVATKKTAKTWCDNIQASYGSGVTCALD